MVLAALTAFKMKGNGHPVLLMTPGWWFYLKQLLMYISKGIDGKLELSTHLCCLSTRKNESECQKKIHYSVGQISADNTSDELTFLNDSFDKMATCFRDCI